MPKSARGACLHYYHARTCFGYWKYRMSCCVVPSMNIAIQVTQTTTQKRRASRLGASIARGTPSSDVSPANRSRMSPNVIHFASSSAEASSSSLSPAEADPHAVYRVQQKSNPLIFFTVFSAVAWNFRAKFYRHMYSVG